MAGRGTAATVLLTRQGIAHTVHSYSRDPQHGSYGAEAAEALDIDPGRVLKTLVADVDGDLAVGVVPVAAQLAGRRGLEIELAPADLVRAANATVAPISRPHV